MFKSFFGILCLAANLHASQDLPEKVEETSAKVQMQIPPPSEDDLVSVSFPQETDIKNLVEAFSLWTGKNFIIDRDVTGKISIIAPRKVTKEEAYQAFLSALNMAGLTTVEAGGLVKIMKIPRALTNNIKTFVGRSWAPRTDQIVSQIVRLKHVDAKQIQTTLSKFLSTNAMLAYEPTNTLIITDTGHKVRKVLEILDLIDVKTQQAQIQTLPVKNLEAKSVSDRVDEILKASYGASKSVYNSFKIMTDDRTNSVIVFGSPRIIADVKDIVETFDVPATQDPSQASIHVRPLDYADAKSLATTLASLASSSSSSRSSQLRNRSKKSSTPGGLADLGDGVKITADDSSNSLIITGSKGAYETLNSIIRKLDVRRSQVFLETAILDLADDSDFRHGASIFNGFGSASGNKGIVGWEAGKMSPLVVATAQASQGTNLTANYAKNIADAFSENLTIGVLAGKSVDIPGLGKFSPGFLVDLMKNDSNTRSLLTPHMLTLNNQEVSFTVGEKLFYQTSTLSSTGVATPKVEKENIDLTLTLTPTISYSDHVTLKIDMQSNTLKGIQAGLPQVTKRKTAQVVTVKNNQTVVISGLVTTAELDSYKKIPGLGDLPLIGALFRNSQKRSIRSNLMIFLTPHVIHGHEDLAAIYKKKLEERDVYLSKIYGKRVVNSDFYKQLPKREDGIYRPTKIDAMEDMKIQERRQEAWKASGYEGGKGGESFLNTDFSGEGDQEESQLSPPPPLENESALTPVQGETGE